MFEGGVVQKNGRKNNNKGISAKNIPVKNKTE